MKEGALDGLALFIDFPESERRVLEAVMIEQRAPKGHVFIREGELARATTSAVYVVIEGHVHVARRASGANAAAVSFMVGPGAMFGIIGLATDIPRSATCTAATDVLVASLNHPAFQHLRGQNTRLAARFELMLARQVVRDLRALTSNLVGAFRRGYTADFQAVPEG